MIIPGQLPPIVTAARSSALQALALKAGQVVSATVIGPAPNGGTQVQIGGQTLNLVLPHLALAGEALRLEVQGSGAQLRLALQAAPGPAASAARPASAPAAPAGPSSATAAPPVSAQAGTAGSTAPAVPARAAATVSSTPTAAPPLPASPIPTAPPATASVAPVATPVGPTPGGATPATPASPQAPVTIVLPGQAATPAALPASPAAPLGQAPTAAAALSPPAASVPTMPPMAQTVLAATPMPASTATMPGATPPPSAALAPNAALPSTPQAALAQMVQAALPQQNSIVGLTAALTSIVGAVALPEPVARAAQQVLANQLTIPAGKLDAAVLQKAVLNSGIFLEAGQARAGVPTLAPPADMKAALLTLRQTLTNWLAPQLPAIAAMAQIAPPLRGKFPRVTGTDIPPIDPATAADEVGKHLFERTEAALSRMRLHQHASLPDPNIKGAEWSMDLPIVIAGHQTLLQLQIHRDEQNPGEATAERGWQMRFAVNLPKLGEVGAQVTLRGTATGIMLWASEPATSAALESDIEGLRTMLAGAGLTPGALIVRHGAPLASQQAVNSGHLVDATT